MTPEDLFQARKGRPIYTPPQGPAGLPPPSREIFAAMGQGGIFSMLKDFYAELEKSPIRAMFPQDMQAASEKSAKFFVGLLGGPPLYHQEYGNPRMRARHMPFVIDEQARVHWLACFRKAADRAVQEHGFPPQHLDGFLGFLEGFSAWMVNAAPKEGA